MEEVSSLKIRWTIPLVMLIVLFALGPVIAQAQDGRPVADAGSSRYAATDPVRLDGTGSYDPDNSGTLSYTWQQISGPGVIITDANTTTPTISGFVQTDEIQECEFKFVVSDGELTSLPDTVKVIIVPDFGVSTLRLTNDSFDPNKPTLIMFGGGDCITGQGSGAGPVWAEKANIISSYYGPDSSIGGSRTYYRYGDMVIVYLSSVAPDYKQLIQTSGFSTGGQPAIDVGIRLNLTYQDARYAVNRVTFFDATRYCRDYSESITAFLCSSVDGEQCWADAYVSTTSGGQHPVGAPFQENVLNVWFPTATGTWGQRHELAQNWYRVSPTDSNKNNFNHGVVAGPYWSVIGPGKNLQLASTTDAQTYKFQWHGDVSSGYMDFYDEPNHPGRLPEPVILVGPEDGAFVDANGAVFSCEESENAVGYQLLFGAGPYRVMDYCIISDTPNPPSEIVSTSPSEPTWWTVRVYDQYGSTIYADPICVNFEILAPPLIENLTTGRRYASIRRAVDDAQHGHEIVVSPGIYKGDISFQGKNLTLRSSNPNNSAIVATTIIEGSGKNSVVTFSSNEDTNCVIAGFTITGGNAENGGGIYCGNNGTPIIVNCVITNNSATQTGGGICTENSSPTVRNCIINGNTANLGAGVYTGSGNTTLINCTLAGNTGFWAGGIYNFDGSPVLTSCILWGNTDPEIGVMAMATYSDIRGGWPGEGNIDADPLFADAANGDYHLKSQVGRWNAASDSSIIDNVTSPCIDAGDPSTPFGSEPSPNGGIINMGAYGGTVEASKSP